MSTKSTSRGITRESAIKGGLWSAMNGLGRQGLQFVVQLLLARLLLPEDFGLIAMVMVVVQIASVFVRAGFGMAVIQRENLDQADVSTAFWLNLALAVLAYGILFFAAPWLADFYGQPQLTLLTWVLALNLITGAINNIQISLLQRNLKFREIFFGTLPGTVISGILGVTAAVIGWGVWALVVQIMSGTVFNIMLLWRLSGWRPSFLFSLNSARAIFAFGISVVGSQFIEQFFRQLYTLIIGALYSPALLGFYNRAQAIQQMPTMTAVSIVKAVALPTLSRAQNDRARMIRGLREAVRLLSLCVGPGMVVLAVLADPVVRLILTEKWLPLVPYLQMFCVIGWFEPRFRLIVQAVLACGRSDHAMKIIFYRRLLDLTFLAFTFDKGVGWIVAGQVTSFVMGLVVDHVYLMRNLSYSIGAQLTDLISTSAISLLVGIAVWLASMAFQGQTMLQISLGFMVGAIVYFSSFCLFEKKLFEKYKLEMFAQFNRWRAST